MISDNLKNEILDGLEYFKNSQGKKYNAGDTRTKTFLSNFRKNLITFTDKIFSGFNSSGKGMWLKQDGKTIQNYIWNRYQPFKNESHLVVYFAVLAEPSSFYVSIGLIDDKLENTEKKIKK